MPLVGGGWRADRARRVSRRGRRTNSCRLRSAVPTPPSYAYPCSWGPSPWLFVGLETDLRIKEEITWKIKISLEEHVFQTRNKKCYGRYKYLILFGSKIKVENTEFRLKGNDQPSITGVC